MPSAAMNTRDFSLTVGTSAIQVSPAATFGAGLSFLRVWNVSPTATVWCSRSGNPAVVNGAGSFPLLPGQYEMFVYPQAIPLNPWSLIASAANTPVTIEAG